MIFFADLEKDGTAIRWAVYSLDKQKFYGTGGLNNLSKEHKKAESSHFKCIFPGIVILLGI